ncbi:class I SAM-dependent methyltransferase [Cohnella lubricantis]|uniref:class I SAM-dependent methyltransferase n=1 Tax=Cohnella lubricantis TaxID=2163172 RepID=UPI00289361A8|nr:class I SAM-dependent methyltransferase [Cohnella lubricantis]MBP2118586.1 16S rRNA G966 N2-methylase RsmD [Cohnella lubricantis]
MTTIERPDEETVRYAMRIAEELGCAYAPRRRDTIRGLMRAKPEAADGVLAAGPEGLKFSQRDEPPLFYHPSMAFIRAKRLREGGYDAMAHAAGAKPGDAVLDCTAGLGSDALVFSVAVGAEGRVTALEASPLLHLIVREGMRTYQTELPDINEAMRRIQHIKAEHLAYLRSLPDKSYDIVYFDPMFTKPVMASASLMPLRTVAEDSALTQEAVMEARRVARRAVMLKDHRDSKEFERLGFIRPRRTANAVAYGVITLR